MAVDGPLLTISLCLLLMCPDPCLPLDRTYGLNVIRINNAEAATKTLCVYIQYLITQRIQVHKLTYFSSPFFFCSLLPTFLEGLSKHHPKRRMPMVYHCFAVQFFIWMLILKNDCSIGSFETSHQQDVWYHFKEGYSNAVRRNVKMSDFV